MKPKRNPVRFLRNGLVNVKKVPDCMIQFNKENAKCSLLLRLPGELRNMIWDYVFTHQWIDVAGLYHLGFPAVSYSYTFALHVPEVCRQIYAETALLGYQINTFSLGTFRCCIDHWVHQLRRWQKCAISTVAFDEGFFDDYLGERLAKKLKKNFPNLKRIEAYGRSTQSGNSPPYYSGTAAHRHGYLRGTKQQRQAQASYHVAMREGSGVEIVIIEPEEDQHARFRNELGRAKALNELKESIMRRTKTLVEV